MDARICQICGGEGATYRNHLWKDGGYFQHRDPMDCVDFLKERAEAAEDDLRELRENTLLALGLNPVDVATGMEDQSIAYLLGGLKERIAELEARLAEQEWQPMTEGPEYGQHVQIIVDDVEFARDGWYGDGFYFNSRARFEWRPLPPPPAATE